MNGTCISILAVLSALLASGCSATQARQKVADAPSGVTDLVSFSFHDEDKTTKESSLPVSILSEQTASVDPKLKVLCLRVNLTNASQKPIRVSAAHEWHGGIWPPTDVYTVVSTRNAERPRRFHPVYLAGESGKIATPTIVLPGKSASLSFRMDWPGTGSCPASPLMTPSMGREYKVRFLFVFEANGTRQYVVSQEADVKADFKEDS